MWWYIYIVRSDSLNVRFACSSVIYVYYRVFQGLFLICTKLVDNKALLLGTVSVSEIIVSLIVTVSKLISTNLCVHMHEFKWEADMHVGMLHFASVFFGDSPADSGHCSRSLFTPMVISTQSCCQCACSLNHNIYLHICTCLQCYFAPCIG